MLDCHIHLETGPYTLAWVKNMLAMLFKEAFRKSTCWSTVTSSQNFYPCTSRFACKMILLTHGWTARVESAIWMNFCTSPMKFAGHSGHCQFNSD